MRQLLIFLISGGVLIAALSAATSPKFGSREDYAGLYTVLTNITEFNNDGNPGLVAVLGGVLHTLLGDGMGNFQTASNQDVAAKDTYRMLRGF